MILYNLEGLTSDSVGILKLEPNSDPWRVALQNDTVGRKMLADVLADHPDELAKVLAVWGDEPTVADLEMQEPPEMPDEDPIYNEKLLHSLLDEVRELRQSLDELAEAQVTTMESLTELAEVQAATNDELFRVARVLDDDTILRRER